MNVLAIQNRGAVTTILMPVDLVRCDDCGVPFLVLENGTSWVVLRDLGPYENGQTLGDLKQLQVTLGDVLIRQTDESLGLIAEHNLQVVERELERFEKEILKGLK